jgi:hypothetical protein
LQQAENENGFLDRRTGCAGFTGGLGEWLGYEDGRLVPLEGQRPRLTHFSTTAVRNRFQTQLQGIDHRGHREQGVDNEVLQQVEIVRQQPKGFKSGCNFLRVLCVLCGQTILPSPCRIFTKSSHFTLLRLIALKFAVDLAGESCQKHFKTLRYV